MRIRTVLLSWLVTILLASPCFAQIVHDEHGNCPSKDANGDWLCSAANYGDANAPGVRSVFNLLVIGVTETGILTNTGSVAYNVVIEQGLRWGDGVKVTPGQSINIGPLDNGIFSWAVWAPVIIVSPDISVASKGADPHQRAHSAKHDLRRSLHHQVEWMSPRLLARSAHECVVPCGLRFRAVPLPRPMRA